MNKVAILVSGGIESTLLMYELADKKPVCIFVNYGQRSAEMSKNYIKIHTDRLSLDFIELRVSIPFQNCDDGMFTDMLIDDSAMNNDTDSFEMDSWYKGYWIEGLNYYTFLSAIGYCAKNSITNLYTGIHYVDEVEWSNLDTLILRKQDSGNYFIAICNMMASCGFSRAVAIHAPYLVNKLGKAETVKKAKELNLLEETISCSFGTNCGKCNACIERSKYDTF